MSFGSSSARGSSANRRSRRRGCGTQRPSSSTRSSPYTRRSRSTVRGPQRSPRTRPNERSVSSRRSRRARGVRLVSIATAPFRKGGWSTTPTAIRLAQLRHGHDVDAVGALRAGRRRGEASPPAGRDSRPARRTRASRARTLDDGGGIVDWRVEHDVRLAHANAHPLDRREALDDAVRYRAGEAFEE